VFNVTKKLILAAFRHFLLSEKDAGPSVLLVESFRKNFNTGSSKLLKPVEPSFNSAVYQSRVEIPSRM
jgi:hypothetical protein